MRGPQRIVLGTRGSELARAQTRLVEKALRAASLSIEIETKIISTLGDESGSLHFAGRKGVFTREIEQALRRSEIDVAVHSAKDLPSDTSDDLEICAALPRAAINDALILKETADLKSLRQHAVVGTGSVRRQHQLGWKRPDLRFVDLRGNVPTRLRKLIDADWDGIVLARAGLERLGHNLSGSAFDFEGRSLHVELLLPNDFLPAGGQGIIAVQTRRNDAVVKNCVRAINHPSTLLCLRAEREFLRLLEADCNSPVAVFATIEAEMMTLRAQVFQPPAIEPKTGIIRSNLRSDEPNAVADALHTMMYERS